VKGCHHSGSPRLSPTGYHGLVWPLAWKSAFGNGESILIGLDTVKQVAHLSRLELTAQEEQRFTEQLGAILSHVEALQLVPTEGVIPTHHPLPLPNVLRADVVQPSLLAEEVLFCAPASEQGMFRVPRILAE